MVNLLRCGNSITFVTSSIVLTYQFAAAVLLFCSFYFFFLSVTDLLAFCNHRCKFLTLFFVTDEGRETETFYNVFNIFFISFEP